MSLPKKNVFFFFFRILGKILAPRVTILPLLPQGSHRLEKHLNIQDCLEKSLKIKFALKNTQRP